MFLSVTTSLQCNNNHNKFHKTTYRPCFWHLFCPTPESLTFCKSSDDYCKFTVCNQPITVHPLLYLSSSCIIFTNTHTKFKHSESLVRTCVYVNSTLPNTAHRIWIQSNRHCHKQTNVGGAACVYPATLITVRSTIVSSHCSEMTKADGDYSVSVFVGRAGPQQCVLSCSVQGSVPL